MEAGRKNGHASIRLTILRVDKQQAAHEWGARQSLSFRGGCGIRIGSDVHAACEGEVLKLCKLIAEGKATPSFIISHELPLDRAAEAYENFDARKEGWTKVVLKPGH
jgi:threonine dehydrogenase-like Zn-dependent dehydrogenase